MDQDWHISKNWKIIHLFWFLCFIIIIVAALSKDDTNKKNAIYYYNKGYNEYENENYYEAEKNLITAGELDANLILAKEFVGYINYIHFNNPQKAIYYCNSFDHEKLPDSTKCAFYGRLSRMYSDSYFKTEHAKPYFDSALIYANKAMTYAVDNIDSAYVYVSLGKCYYVMRNKDEKNYDVSLYYFLKSKNSYWIGKIYEKLYYKTILDHHNKVLAKEYINLSYNYYMKDSLNTIDEIKFLKDMDSYNLLNINEKISNE